MATIAIAIERSCIGIAVVMAAIVVAVESPIIIGAIRAAGIVAPVERTNIVAAAVEGSDVAVPGIKRAEIAVRAIIVMSHHIGAGLALDPLHIEALRLSKTAHQASPACRRNQNFEHLVSPDIYSLQNTMQKHRGLALDTARCRIQNPFSGQLLPLLFPL